MFKNLKEFEDLLNSLNKDKKTSLTHFWAPWCNSCPSMDNLCETLEKKYQNLKFLKVEAEKFPDITEKFNITCVPSFLIQENGKNHIIEGANSPEVVKQIKQYSSEKTTEKNKPTETSLNEQLKKLINSSENVIFIKGTPDEPECGFSEKAIAVLNKNYIPFNYFNILSDEKIKEGLKNYSNWKTYPQLYHKGKLIGGWDIIRELDEENELLKTLEIEHINDRLKKLINLSENVLFMKGTPENAECGFSSKAVKVLQGNNIKFSYFNILSDDGVREGLKVYSNWKTYPQLYHKGKLVGGWDIIRELDEEGELLKTLGKE